MNSLSLISVDNSKSIRDAIVAISKNSMQLVCVVGSNNTYIGTITDGDVRRGLLKGCTLDSSVLEIVNFDSFYLYETDISQAQIRNAPKGIRIIPIVDEHKTLIRLLQIDDFEHESLSSIPVVIMAGGKGERLRPLTNSTPKPMLPVGDKPMLEKLITELKEFGFKDFHVTVNYLADQIIEYFGDGSRFDVKISIYNETNPRGTAGALSDIVINESSPLLVMNSDLITTVDFRALIDFHNSDRNEMTICTRSYEVQIPFGVIDSQNGLVVGLEEKPIINFLVSAGIYVLSSTVLSLIPKDVRLDMPDLILNLIYENRPVGAFPIFETWLDVGRHDDLAKARKMLIDRKD